MGVAPDVVEDLVWAAEGSLGVDDPVGLPGGREMRGECTRLAERRWAVDRTVPAQARKAPP
jgi:hypothetical protein